tara:strand:+ start:527 stop:748 length:222 start_codon:yes stop_codon:yes gene_type:complete
MTEQVFGSRLTQNLASEKPGASRYLTDIAQHKKTWPVDLMCRLLGVTRGGYYSYQRRGVAVLIIIARNYWKLS